MNQGATTPKGGAENRNSLQRVDSIVPVTIKQLLQLTSRYDLAECLVPISVLLTCFVVRTTSSCWMDMRSRKSVLLEGC